MQYKAFWVAIPYNDNPACQSFEYVLTKPGIPRVFTSWTEFTMYAREAKIAPSLLENARFVSPPADGCLYTTDLAVDDIRINSEENYS